MTRVIVCSTRNPVPKPFSGRVFRIDRRTPLGNPFKLEGPHPSQRRRCIEQFRQWLPGAIATNRETKRYFREIVETAKSGVDIALLCYCSPKPCHGDVIKEFVEAAIKPATGPLDIPEFLRRYKD